ncbi:MAG: transcriptional regulator [Moraxellaceae bacterium]|jgi:TetR/AcrR family acrAB operon transcriptional repressor|nr:transcriptional regulator [Moraxellaceae bacterium]
MRDKLLSALRDAARHSAPRLPSLTEVALLAQASEAEVREHLGPPENFSALLSYQAPAHETRDRIIASAARVFARKGFQKASLDEVAADAGLTKGAIYWHFRNKNDLLFALLDCRLRQDTAPLMGDLQTLIRDGGDAQATLTRMFASGIARCTSDPDWGRLYLECLNLSRDDEVRERLAGFYDQVWAMSGSFTRELQRHGITAGHMDPASAGVFWTALFDGLVIAWLIKGDQIDFERLLPTIFRMLWQGMAPRASDSNDKNDFAPETHHDA